MSVPKTRRQTFRNRLIHPTIEFALAIVLKRDFGFVRSPRTEYPKEYTEWIPGPVSAPVCVNGTGVQMRITFLEYTGYLNRICTMSDRANIKRQACEHPWSPHYEYITDMMHIHLNTKTPEKHELLFSRRPWTCWIIDHVPAKLHKLLYSKCSRSQCEPRRDVRIKACYGKIRLLRFVGFGAHTHGFNICLSGVFAQH